MVYCGNCLTMQFTVCASGSTLTLSCLESVQYGPEYGQSLLVEWLYLTLLYWYDLTGLKPCSCFIWRKSHRLLCPSCSALLVLPPPLLYLSTAHIPYSWSFFLGVFSLLFCSLVMFTAVLVWQFCQGYWCITFIMYKDIRLLYIRHFTVSHHAISGHWLVWPTYQVDTHFALPVPTD